MDGHNLNTYNTRKYILDLEIEKSPLNCRVPPATWSLPINQSIKDSSDFLYECVFSTGALSWREPPRKLPVKGRSLLTGGAAAKMCSWAQVNGGSVVATLEQWTVGDFGDLSDFNTALTHTHITQTQSSGWCLLLTWVNTWITLWGWDTLCLFKYNGI